MTIQQFLQEYEVTLSQLMLFCLHVFCDKCKVYGKEKIFFAVFEQKNIYPITLKFCYFSIHEIFF